MEFFPATDDAAVALRGATLIVPAVSIGNVAQLAIDLIIETHRCPRIGRLIHPAILPTAGAVSFSHLPAPTFSLELFELPVHEGREENPERQEGASNPLIILQQRSPAAPGTQEAFASSLIAWAKDMGIQQAVLLGSLDGRFRHGSQLGGPAHVRSYVPEAFTESLGTYLEEACRMANVPALEDDFEPDGKTPSTALSPPWPHLRACVSSNLPCVAFLSFVLEGFNVPDAVEMVECVAKAFPSLQPSSEANHENPSEVVLQESAALNAGSGKWRHPQSWEYILASSVPLYGV